MDKNQATEIAIELGRVERRATQDSLTTTQIKRLLNDTSKEVRGYTLIVPTTISY